MSEETVIDESLPKNDKEKFILVKNIIKDYCSNYTNNIVDIQDVIRVANNKGIDGLFTEDVIEKLKRDGYIYEPRNGRISLVN